MEPSQEQPNFTPSPIPPVSSATPTTKKKWSIVVGIAAISLMVGGVTYFFKDARLSLASVPTIATTTEVADIPNCSNLSIFTLRFTNFSHAIYKDAKGDLYYVADDSRNNYRDITCKENGSVLQTGDDNPDVKPLLNIDTSTFKVIMENGDQYFYSDKNHVYLLTITASTDDTRESFTILDGADPATFQVLVTQTAQVNSISGVYEQDSKHVYYRGSIVSVADTASFSLNEDFSNPSWDAQDKSHKYLQGNIVEIYTKDTIGPLTKIESDLFKDGQGNIYTYGESDASNGAYTKISGVDGSTFKAIPAPIAYEKSHDAFQYFSKGEGGAWSTLYVDKNHVYVFSDDYGLGSSMGSLVVFANIDPVSVVIVNGAYTKDKNAVFYDTAPISGADPNSFQDVGAGFIKDKNHVYLGGEIFLGADTASFVDVDQYFAKDKNHVYVSYKYGAYQQYVVDGADPGTFVSVGRGYGKDSSAVYNFSAGKVVDADLNSFVSIDTQNGLGYGVDAKDKNHQYQVGEMFTGQ